jgi:uncharacterized protein with ParB-like and HNH nuclease domain
LKSKLTNELLIPEKIFSDCLFCVPDYQRGYAWENRQRAELLEDLELLPANKHHYTGTLVLHGSNGKQIENKRGETFHTFDIVDGQQRLTTIVLLLHAIKKELKHLNDSELADGLAEKYLFITDRNGQVNPKLKLNRDCHDFFHTCLKPLPIFNTKILIA